MTMRTLLALWLLACVATTASAAPPLAATDVFELQWAGDPQVSPDGRQVAYVRYRGDVMKDTFAGDIWIVSVDGREHRPVTPKAASPRWSPDGTRLLYVAAADTDAQLFVRWMDTGATAQVTRVQQKPSHVAWSPDGRSVAFVMPVAEETKPLAEPMKKPDGAEWAAPPKVIEKLIYRSDGEGYLADTHAQVFVVPALGGTPRQLTTGAFDHDGPLTWTPDGQYLLVSANRHPEAESDPVNSEVHEIRVADGTLRTLTSRQGPDRSPTISPDGRRIAWLGYDDQRHGYENSRLQVMNRDGGGTSVVSAALDRSVEQPTWAPSGREVVVNYEDEGRVKLAALSLDGKLRVLADDLGGLSIGRPYSTGDFSVSKSGVVAYTAAGPDRLADVAIVPLRGGTPQRLTDLSADLLAQRNLGKLEEFWVPSSHDGTRVQAWVITPPGFDPANKYPLILEIHGGPFAAYGPTFAAELQLYAAAGYVVLYVNPRGSTGYGKAFGNAIHHAYPGYDYDDLMSAVDAVIARGYVDPAKLFVTGGSGGGVLTAWIVGKNDRFRAAVVQKPVINWTSFVLTADRYNFFGKYWFPDLPWDAQAQYWARSPLSLVGNVKTPTMVLTGEEDYRTPISESEQYYQALKLRQVPTALVRVPGAGHGLDQRPSQLASKVAHVLAWFERHAATDVR
ncbi:MAG: S9 family peptidase [Steroidobacteraceae bacterium]|nr:S9 family peptidase [Steroidobacteraceae bacterium]